MRRAVGACLPLLAVLAPHAGARDLREIETRRSLRVLVALDTRRPEFFSLKSDAPGFDHEVLAGFAEHRGLKLEVVQVQDWRGLVPALLERQGDLIAGRFGASESRKKLINFTTEVFPRRLVVMTRKPHRIIKSLQELRAERVGTVKGTGMAEAVAAAGVPPSKVDDGIEVGGDLPAALRSGRVTAAVWGAESVIVAQREDPDIQIGMFVGKPESVAFGVRKEDTELLGVLNEHIDRLHRSGAWNRLVVKYFGESALEILRKARSE